MEIVGDVPEVGAYGRPVTSLEGLSNVAAAALANWFYSRCLLHSRGATTLWSKSASSRSWPWVWHRCHIDRIIVRFRKLECRVPGWAAGRRYGHLRRSGRKLLHGRQHQIRQRHASQIRVHQNHRMPFVAHSSWQPIWRTQEIRLISFEFSGSKICQVLFWKEFIREKSCVTFFKDWVNSDLESTGNSCHLIEGLLIQKMFKN